MSKELLDQYMPKVRWIAKKARKDVVSLVEAPDASYGEGDYTGYCALASYMLVSAVHIWTPLVAEFSANYYHAWVVLRPDRSAKGVIVDPTYCQYVKSRPVYVGNGTKRHQEGVTGISAIREVRDYWLCDQNPFLETTNKTILKWARELAVPGCSRIRGALRVKTF